MSHALYRMGRFAARRPWVVVGAWLVVSVTVIAASGAFGRELDDSVKVPGLDSQQAVDLLSASALGVTAPPEVRSILRIRLRTLGGASFSELQLDSLRFFLDAQPGVVHRLHELFLRHPQGLAVQALPGAPARFLGPEAIRPVGFAREEGLLEYPDESFLGYRILQEYFAYPDKFMFVELCGLASGSSPDWCTYFVKMRATLRGVRRVPFLFRKTASIAALFLSCVNKAARASSQTDIAFLAEAPSGRTATTTSFTPESRMLSTCAWPCEP